LVANFSLFPLIKKEKAIIGYIVTSLIWLLVTSKQENIPENDSIIRKIIRWGSYVGILAIHIGELFIAPPSHLPDLYPVLNALLSFCVFGFTFLYLNYRQFRD